MISANSGSGGHEILGGFEDGCGWFFGEGGYFSDPVDVHI